MEIKGAFKETLSKCSREGDDNLLNAYERIYRNAATTWLGDLGQEDGSYKGLPHIQAVEHWIYSMTSRELLNTLYPTEIYLLLLAILFHDIGKIRTIRQKVEEDYKLDPSVEYLHGQYSCLHVLKQWPHLKILDERVAKYTALLSCSHHWQAPRPGSFEGGESDNPTPYSSLCKEICPFGCSSKKEQLQPVEVYGYGKMRLNWIAALLRLGDEIDVSYKRVVAQELGSDPSDSKRWRAHIEDISFDRTGEAVKLLLNDRADIIFCEDDTRTQLSTALRSINRVLSNWHELFFEMNLPFKEAFWQTTDLRDQLFDHRLKADIEPSLRNGVLDNIEDAAMHLLNGIIGINRISWDSLAAEAGLLKVDLVKLGAERLNRLAQRVKFTLSEDCVVLRRPHEEVQS